MVGAGTYNLGFKCVVEQKFRKLKKNNVGFLTSWSEKPEPEQEREFKP